LGGASFLCYHPEERSDEGSQKIGLMSKNKRIAIEKAKKGKAVL